MESDRLNEEQQIVNVNDGNIDKCDNENSLRRCINKMFCCIPARYILVIWAFLGFMTVYILRINISIALTVMVNNSATAKTKVANQCNFTQNQNMTDGPFNWNPQILGYINGAFFWGYIPLQIPAGWLGVKVGGKWLFGVGILWTAAFTLLTPLAAHAGYGWLIALRVLEGLGESITYPGIHTMLGFWAPVMEITVMGGIIYSGSLFGLCIGLISTPIIINNFGGWQYVFYIHGMIGVVWFIIWIFVAYSTPAKHPRITKDERNYIESSIELSSDKYRNVPWLKILMSVPVLAITITNFTAMWSIYTLMTSLPQYFQYVQGFNIQDNSYVNALPFFLSVLAFIVAGRLADLIRNRKWLGITAIRKLFNTIGGVVNAVFIVAICYVGCDQVLVVTFLCIGLAVGVFNTAGYNINHIDLAPQYAGILLGITNSFASFAGIIGPYITGALTSDNETEAQWQKVFYISSGVTMFGTIFYLIFGSGLRQEWAMEKDEIPILDNTDDDADELDDNRNQKYI